MDRLVGATYGKNLRKHRFQTVAALFLARGTWSAAAADQIRLARPVAVK
jgi:hypothetical protein